MHEDASITNLLFACVAPPLATPRERFVAALDGITHWPRVMELAAMHRMAPLLAGRLRHYALLDAVPDATRRHLEQLYLAAAARQVRLQEELHHVLTLFRREGIPALPMRGPLLAAQLGIDPATRPCDDLDFLLNRQDLPRACEALRQAGFAPFHAPPTPAAAAHAIRTGGAHVLQKPGAGFQADMTWTLTPCYFLQPITMDTLRPYIQAGALNPESLLVTLCIHGTKHLWSRHLWTHDVAALLAQRDVLDWEAAWAIAQDLGGSRMLLLGAAWAARVTGLPVPRALAARLTRDRTVPGLCDALAAHFAKDPGWVPADDGVRARFHLRAQAGPAARLRYVAWRALAPSPNDWRALQLPDALFPLYALLRPLRLAWRSCFRNGFTPRRRAR